jgi:hypothetical protein
MTGAVRPAAPAERAAAAPTGAGAGLKGKRRRSEGAGGESVSIMQCDLRRTVQLAPAAKTYRVTPFGELFGARTAGAARTDGPPQAAAARGGTVKSATS